MPLITSKVPESWEELEIDVANILQECGMNVRRQVAIDLPRGTVDIDVFAEEIIDSIRHSVICECKNWKTNIPKDVVHAFRTVMHETGTNQGYIISRVGFQSGAINAAIATNINLVTFQQFQELYFTKWYRKRLWSIEEKIERFNVYYEPLGKPGYDLLVSDEERRDYDIVWHQYLFAGLMLMSFSPYTSLIGGLNPPSLPFDLTKFEERGISVPSEFKAVSGYRELLSMLENAASEGLIALRGVNPITRGVPSESIDSDDQRQ